MIGQYRLKEKLDKYDTIQYFPKAVIFQGPKYSGKHTVVNELVNRFDVELEEIKEALTTDKLAYMYTISIPKIYLIDLDAVEDENHRVDNFDNSILKFIEEPPEFAWIILLVSRDYSLLETITNRCQIYYMDRYSESQIREVAEYCGKKFDLTDLHCIKYPGYVIKYDNAYVSSLIKLANQVVESLGSVTPSNALSIENRFFGEDPYDLDLFIDILHEIVFQKYMRERETDKYYEANLVIASFRQHLQTYYIDRKKLFENFILLLKEALGN